MGLPVEHPSSRTLEEYAAHGRTHWASLPTQSIEGVPLRDPPKKTLRGGTRENAAPLRMRLSAEDYSLVLNSNVHPSLRAALCSIPAPPLARVIRLLRDGRPLGKAKRPPSVFSVRVTHPDLHPEVVEAVDSRELWKEPVFCDSLVDLPTTEALKRVRMGPATPCSGGNTAPQPLPPPPPPRVPPPAPPKPRPDPRSHTYLPEAFERDVDAQGKEQWEFMTWLFLCLQQHPVYGNLDPDGFESLLVSRIAAPFARIKDTDRFNKAILQCAHDYRKLEGERETWHGGAKR